MGCLCITAAPDLRARLRLTGCCIPVVKELQRQCAGQKQRHPHPQAKWRGRAKWADVVGATGCSQHSPCLQALPLLGFHFQKVGRKPELTLMWEPEKPEQESVPQVRPPSAGRAHNTMGLAWRLCATCGSRGLRRDRSGRQDCLTGSRVLLSLCAPSPASPTSASTSSAIQPRSISSPPPHLTPPRPSDSALPAVCPASQISFLQELN